MWRRGFRRASLLLARNPKRDLIQGVPICVAYFSRQHDHPQMLVNMSSSVAIPFGEHGVDSNNARGVVKMAGAADPLNADNSIFWLKETTVAGVMAGLHRYPGAAVMIPAKNTEHAPCRFVSVHTYASFECKDGRRRYQDVQKSLQYGDINEKLASSVGMALSKEDEKCANIVIVLTSNHEFDCPFTVVAKTPGQKDHCRETVLGAPRLVDIDKANSSTGQTWDWRFFLTSGKVNALNDEGYTFDRRTVWEVWTVIEGVNTRVFDIKFSAV